MFVKVGELWLFDQATQQSKFKDFLVETIMFLSLKNAKEYK